jgi:Calcineurin-like phosphoesterase
MRYAHPFFTAQPPDKRPADFSAFGQRMTDWIAEDLGEIPAPRTAESVLDLADVIGQEGVDEITAAGAIKFHAVGDTGQRVVHGVQEELADQMARDYVPGLDAHNPAFFLHLGDVIYGAEPYTDEFYRAYYNYPGKILAIPGNHDGETEDKLAAFQANFCTPAPTIPPDAASTRILRQTMTQPGVYYLLRAPFVDVVCMYSNIAEGPGFIVGTVQATKEKDTKQSKWLSKTLASLAAERKQGSRKALIFAVHHPPYSSGGKGGSPDMLSDFDDACKAAKIQPDAVLSGHAHNYQRYTRVGGVDKPTPYIVAGSGGHGRQPPGTPDKTVHDGVSFDEAFEVYGYLLVTATAHELKLEFNQFEPPQRPIDTAKVPL